MVRDDRAKTLEAETYLCNRCAEKKRYEQKFRKALGDGSDLIKETHVQGKHRYILVDCSLCNQPYWARFDAWEEGQQKCWPCAHPGSKKHGKTGTELYKRWANILRRTVYSNEPEKLRVYKDRGIAMCDEWRNDFISFDRWALDNGYKKHLILDRIDNYKGYNPDNCRWVTTKVSTQNRRKATYI